MTHICPVISLVLAVLFFLQTAQLHQARNQVAALEQLRELARAQNAELEERHRHEIEQQDQQTKSAIAAAHADAGRARAAAVGLRRELAGFIEAHRHRAQAASTAGQCAPDDAASVVLAELFQRADDAAGELAAAFDESRARGLGCEASYGAVAGE